EGNVLAALSWRNVGGIGCCFFGGLFLSEGETVKFTSLSLFAPSGQFVFAAVDDGLANDVRVFGLFFAEVTKKNSAIIELHEISFLGVGGAVETGMCLRRFVRHGVGPCTGEFAPCVCDC